MQPIVLQTLTIEEFLTELKIDIERLHSPKILTNIQLAPAPIERIQTPVGKQEKTGKRNAYLHASAILRFGDDIDSYYILRAAIFTGVSWQGDSEVDEKDGAIIAYKVL